MKICIIILIVLIQTSLPFSKIKADSKLGVGLNLAGLAIGNVNLEGAIPLSRHLSLHLPLSWNPIRISDKVSFRHFAFQPGVRYWPWHVQSGYFVSINYLFIKYNTTWNKLRHQGSGNGISFSGGYSFMLSKRFNLDIETGIGALLTKYDSYESNRCGEYLGSYTKTVFAPLKFKISIIYIL